MTSDPGISPATQAGGHLNGHIELPPDTGRRNRNKRPVADPVEAELGRWKGKAPDTWSPQRTAAINKVSKFKTRTGGHAIGHAIGRAVTELHEKRRAARALLPDIDDCVLGHKLYELAARGRVYPYPLVQRRRRLLAMPAAAKWKLRDVHLRALGWVIAAHLAMKTKGLVISHRTMGDLLGLKSRQTGTIMRQLCAWGLLESTAWFRADGKLHWQTSSLYTVTPFTILYFDVRPRKSRKTAAPAANSNAPIRVEGNCQPETILPYGKDLKNEGAVGGTPTGLSSERSSTPDADAATVPQAERVKYRPAALLASGEAGLSKPLTLKPSAARRIDEAVAAAVAAAEREVEAKLLVANATIADTMRRLRLAEHRVERERAGRAAAEKAAAELAQAPLGVDWGRRTVEEFAPASSAPAPAPRAPTAQGQEELEAYRRREQIEREERAERARRREELERQEREGKGAPAIPPRKTDDDELADQIEATLRTRGFDPKSGTWAAQIAGIRARTDLPNRRRGDS